MLWSGCSQLLTDAALITYEEGENQLSVSAAQIIFAQAQADVNSEVCLLLCH
jgi:hypothetical protein